MCDPCKFNSYSLDPTVAYPFSNVISSITIGTQVHSLTFKLHEKWREEIEEEFPKSHVTNHASILHVRKKEQNIIANQQKNQPG